MITDIAKLLIVSGQLNTTTADIRVLLLSRDVGITTISTTATPILLSDVDVVKDVMLPTSGVAMTLRASKLGLTMHTDTPVIKLDQPAKVGAMLMYAVGDHGNVDNPILSYSTIDLDYYYNVIIESNGKQLLSIS